VYAVSSQGVWRVDPDGKVTQIEGKDYIDQEKYPCSE